MRSRSLALAATLAALLLAVPAAALWMRVSVHFLATFDLSGAPGGSPPLAADSGSIIVNGPGFSVVNDPLGGGSLLAQGTAAAGDVTLTGLFDSNFKGCGDLIITWAVTPGQSGASCGFSCVEDTDSEIIDVTWDGGGFVDIGGLACGQFQEGVTYDCKLVLKDATIGFDMWTFTMSSSGGPTVTKSGPLLLLKPLVIKAIKIVLPAGSTGSFVFDDIQATSNTSSYK